MSADLDAVVAEVSLALACVPAFASAARRHAGPVVSRITPPAAIVEPANDQTFSQTYGPEGMDFYRLDVTVAVSLLGPAATWAEVTPYVRRQGPSSVRTALEDYPYTSCDNVIVPTYEFVVVTFAAGQYLGATFSAEASG